MSTERQHFVWSWLKSHHIHDLPVDFRKLLKGYNVTLMSYSEGERLLQELGLEDEALIRHGFLASTQNGTYLFYDDTLPKSRQKEVIMHEIGHLAEAHSYPIGKTDYTEAQEAEAQEYVYEMAPTPVLHIAGIKSIPDICRLTGLNDFTAQKIVVRMSEYENRPFTDEEHSICVQFMPFIRRMRRRQMRRKLEEVWIPTVLGALISALICFGVFLTMRGVQSGVADGNGTIPAQTVSSQSHTVPDGQIVYWTPDGEVYHIDRDCQHIRDREALSGTVDESGKDRVCKTCGSEFS